MPEPALSDLFSIGRAAELTGISVATLRVWERRYGKPVPHRLPSGHRRYTREQVTWMRLVAEALSRGSRASKAVPLSIGELERLLDASGSADLGLPAEVVSAVRGFRGDELVRGLRAARNEIGTRRMLTQRLDPLMTTTGRAWATGEIDVRHEHHFSRQVETLLHELLEDVEVDAVGPAVLLTTLPGERHSIGLMMAAIVVALSGARPLLLGVDTPVAEIAASAAELGVRAVALSVSLATGGPATDRVIADLRDVLDDDIVLFVGGAGARGVRRGPRGTVHVRNLDDLERAVHTLLPARDDG